MLFPQDLEEQETDYFTRNICAVTSQIRGIIGNFGHGVNQPGLTCLFVSAFMRCCSAPRAVALFELTMIRHAAVGEVTWRKTSFTDFSVDETHQLNLLGRLIFSHRYFNLIRENVKPTTLFCNSNRILFELRKLCLLSAENILDLLGEDI